jgi:hypothetical protein
MNEWQPIGTAPKDGTPILVWDLDYLNYDDEEPIKIVAWEEYESEYNMKHTGWVLLGCSCLEGGLNTARFPFYWMPLPEPPKGENYER